MLKCREREGVTTHSASASHSMHKTLRTKANEDLGRRKTPFVATVALAAMSLAGEGKQKSRGEPQNEKTPFTTAHPSRCDGNGP